MCWLLKLKVHSLYKLCLFVIGGNIAWSGYTVDPEICLISSWVSIGHDVHYFAITISFVFFFVTLFRTVLSGRCSSIALPSIRECMWLSNLLIDRVWYLRENTVFVLVMVAVMLSVVFSAWMVLYGCCFVP